MKTFGTIVRPRATIAARSSHSRWSALAISTGCTSALKARAKAPLTISSMPPLEALQDAHVTSSRLGRRSRRRGRTVVGPIGNGPAT